MILQVLPSISPHDAISQHVIRVDDELKKSGIDSSILAHHIHPQFSNRVLSQSDIKTFDGTHIVYHMSIASSLAEKIHSSNAAVDLWYHNITPSYFFEPWEPYVSLELRIARHQLAQMAIRADRGVAASYYSQRELEQYGCRHTSVMPVLFDQKQKVASLSTSQRKGTQILSVGRFAPHKKVEKLIMALSQYRKLVDQEAQLHLVGTSSSKWYFESLSTLIDNLNVRNAVHIHDGASDEKLALLYSRADVYLCLSEHEGFCVPLMEAQYSGLPIVALDFAAIKETVNGAGIVLPCDTSMTEIVAAIDIAANDSVIREKITEQAQANCRARSIDEQAKAAVEWIVRGSK